MSFYLLSLFSSMLYAFSPCTFPKWRLMSQTSRYSVLGGKRSPACFATSQMNLRSPKFKLSADMCSSGTDRSSTLVDSSPLPPWCFQLRFFVHSRILPGSKNVHRPFCVVLTVFGYGFRQEISSSSVFGGQKRAAAILAILQWLKILNISIIVSCTISCGTHIFITEYWTGWGLLDYP